MSAAFNYLRIEKKLRNSSQLFIHTIRFVKVKSKK